VSNIRKYIFCFVGTFSIVMSGATAEAMPKFGPKVHTIHADRGGQVISYALRMKRMERDGGHVRFAGRCSSACTLYLALPRDRTCIAPGASFGFHVAYGSSPKGNDVATRYLMRNYPGWVRSWLAQNGGLTSGIKTMNFEYASKYIPVCDASRFANANARHRQVTANLAP